MFSSLWGAALTGHSTAASPNFSCRRGRGILSHAQNWGTPNVAFKFTRGVCMQTGRMIFQEAPLFVCAFLLLCLCGGLPAGIARLAQQRNRVGSADGAHSAASRTSGAGQVPSGRVAAMPSLPLRVRFHPATAPAGGGYERRRAVFPNTETELPDPNRIVASNITPDPEFGAGKWRDADFVRAMRQGIGHDGRTLYAMMPYQYFRSLSDEDLASVIVCERSLAPVHIGRPATILTNDIKKTLQPFPPVEHVPEPNRSDRVAYGKYLVTAGHCDLCHTAADEQGNPIPGMEFAGGGLLIGAWGQTPTRSSPWRR